MMKKTFIALLLLISNFAFASCYFDTSVQIDLSHYSKVKIARLVSDLNISKSQVVGNEWYRVYTHISHISKSISDNSLDIKLDIRIEGSHRLSNQRQIIKAEYMHNELFGVIFEDLAPLNKFCTNGN